MTGISVTIIKEDDDDIFKLGRGSMISDPIVQACTCFSYMRGAGALTQVYQTCTSPYPFDTLVTGMV